MQAIDIIYLVALMTFPVVPHALLRHALFGRDSSQVARLLQHLSLSSLAGPRRKWHGHWVGRIGISWQINCHELVDPAGVTSALRAPVAEATSHS
jgi:hypothetical protein